MKNLEENSWFAATAWCLDFLSALGRLWTGLWLRCFPHTRRTRCAARSGPWSWEGQADSLRRAQGLSCLWRLVGGNWWSQSAQAAITGPRGPRGFLKAPEVESLRWRCQCGRECEGPSWPADGCLPAASTRSGRAPAAAALRAHLAVSPRPSPQGPAQAPSHQGQGSAKELGVRSSFRSLVLGFSGFSIWLCLALEH